MKYPFEKTDEEWKQQLGDEAYRILRKKGTEAPFTGEYDKLFQPGTYFCRGCGHTLFLSSGKFNSGCGWPAFDREAPEAAIERKRDLGFGMIRTEILCSNCGGHLGHVFQDGPTETGERYCVNSASLTFKPQQ
jgi:peptide-methionine (R)-S-oxide reductase